MKKTKTNLKEMWKMYLELENEGMRLQRESGKVWESNNPWKCMRLRMKIKKLWNKADIILENFIEKNYEKEIEINYEYDRIILSNGIILSNDGRVYEPLDVIMRKIIKEHEENK